MKIGIVSFAHGHAMGYLSVLANRPDVTVKVTDDDSTRGAARASEFGVEFVPSYDELLAWKPDGVIVCSENARHRELAEPALRSGAYVLCEKPLATTRADLEALVEIADGRLMTAFPVRFADPVRALERLVRSGELGRIHGVAGTNPGQMPGSWFVDKDLAGGGAVMDHTVHVADLLGWLLESEATTVYAQTNRLLYPDLDVETAGTVVVTFENGTVATIDCSWSRPRSYPTWGTVTLDVTGENGSVSVDAFDQRVEAYADGPGRTGVQGGNAVEWLPWGANADEAMIDEFLSAITEGREPSPSGRDGLRATMIALAAYDSVESGQPVALR